MKTWSAFFLLTILTFSSITSQADTLGFSISNDFLETKYKTDFNNNTAAELNWVYAKEDEIKSNFISAGFFAHNKSGQFHVYLGGRLYFLDADKSDGHGILLGGSVDYHFAEKAFASANLYYAPDILTGGDFENTLDTGISVGYKVLPNADLAIGYRFIESEIEASKKDAEVYNGLYLEFKINI